MVKLLVFAILLASSPATGLIETLFRVETGCYKGCRENFPEVDEHLKACRQGCDCKLHKEDCTTKCLSVSSDEKIRESCRFGCNLNGPLTKEIIKPNPALVDPIPEDKKPDVIAPSNPEPERPRSIILIRLRQRPSFDIPSLQMPAAQPLFNNDPIEFFNNIIKQFQDRANTFEQSVRKSFEQNSEQLPKLELGPISELVKNIPVNPLTNGKYRGDSSSESSESSEEKNGKRPLIDEFKHLIKHPRERIQPVNNRVQQFLSDVRSEWTDIVRRQPRIPIWIFIGILLSSSAILWYMVMSLCRHTPSREPLSIRAQELIFHPYEYDAYEKEKIQPEDQPYEVTESLPIKVKLTNI